MAVLYIVLWNLALIDLHFLLQKIHSELFLQSGIPTIFLVLQNTLNGGGLPFFLACRSGSTFRSQYLADGVWGFALHE